MANSAKVDFLSPVGRLVQGDPFTPQTTDMQGNPLTIKSGPRIGQATQRYLAVIAVSKQDPEFGPFYAHVDALARASWPQFFNGPPGPDGRPTCTNPNMSLKIMDGDGFDGNGQRNADKEGFAGCWIIKTSSSFPPKVYYKDRYQEHEQIKDKNLLRRGYFVRIGGTMESNNNPQKPGLFVNLGQVALWGLGPEITSGPTASQVFGGAAAAPGFTPAGMQALPALPASTGGMPTMPGVGMPAAMPMASPAGQVPPGYAMPTAAPAPMLPPAMPASALPAAPSLPTMPAAMPAPTFVAPNPAILAGPAMPASVPGLPPLPPMMPPAAPAAPATPQLTPAGAATGYTYAQYRQAGYTDDALRAQGFIL